MRFTLSGLPIDFRAASYECSPVLNRCRAAPPEPAESDETLELPLQRDWVEAWDSGAPLAEMSQEMLLGVVKVRAVQVGVLSTTR